MSHIMIEVGFFKEADFMAIESYLDAMQDNVKDAVYEFVPFPNGDGSGTLTVSVKMAQLIMLQALKDRA